MLRESKIGTIEEYKSRINRVMDYIEANIPQAFTLEELSDIANFSKYHFHRIFYSLVGETLFNFIQRIRIEKSAQLIIADRKKPITEIARDCGFSSSALFSRTFKKRFSVTPTEWRNQKGAEEENIPADKIFNATIAKGPAEKEAKNIEKKIQNVDTWMMAEKSLAYVRYMGPYEGDYQLFDRLTKKIYKWAAPRGLITENTEFIIIYHDDLNITDENMLRTSVCITVPANTGADGEIGRLDLPAGNYVRARFLLTSQEFREAWAWVFSVWLPESGYMPDDRPCFEYYPPHDKSGRDNILVDICVPIIPL